MRLFESRSAEHVKPLLDSMEAVLTALEKAGVEPFIAYGTLLGAVRDGHLIGHDSDADLGYVSAHDHPVDVSLESFRLQRAAGRQGFADLPLQRRGVQGHRGGVRRTRRGLDVFGGFLRDGMLYLMGEVGHRSRRSGCARAAGRTLEGRTFPAPADPERLLEAMYGPAWRVPDPAYKFETPQSTVHAAHGWFRGTRVGQDTSGASSTVPARRPGPGPSAFVRWVRECEPETHRRRRRLWLRPRRPVPGAAGSAVGPGLLPVRQRAAERAGDRASPRSFAGANLTELRSVLVTGAPLSAPARTACGPGPPRPEPPTSRAGRTCSGSPAWWPDVRGGSTSRCRPRGAGQRRARRQAPRRRGPAAQVADLGGACGSS